MVAHTYVIVFWKTDLMVTNTEIYFLPVDECHTHALSRDAMHLNTDMYVRMFQLQAEHHKQQINKHLQLPNPTST